MNTFLLFFMINIWYKKKYNPNTLLITGNWRLITYRQPLLLLINYLFSLLVWYHFPSVTFYNSYHCPCSLVQTVFAATGTESFSRHIVCYLWSQLTVYVTSSKSSILFIVTKIKFLFCLVIVNYFFLRYLLFFGSPTKNQRWQSLSHQFWLTSFWYPWINPLQFKLFLQCALHQFTSGHEIWSWIEG